MKCNSFQCVLCLIYFDFQFASLHCTPTKVFQLPSPSPTPPPPPKYFWKLYFYRVLKNKLPNSPYMNELKLNEQQHCSWSTSVKLLICWSWCDRHVLNWYTQTQFSHARYCSLPLLFTAMIHGFPLDSAQINRLYQPVVVDLCHFVVIEPTERTLSATC